MEVFSHGVTANHLYSFKCSPSIVLHDALHVLSYQSTCFITYTILYAESLVHEL